MKDETQPGQLGIASSVGVSVRDWVGGVGLLLIGVALVTASPSVPVGALVILMVAVVVRSSLGAFVIGQIALVASLPTISPVAGVAQLGLLAVLTEPTRNEGDLLAVATTSISFAGLLGLVVFVRGESLLVVGGLLGLVVAGCLYAIHRVTQVQLGLVGSPDTSTEQRDPKPQE